MVEKDDERAAGIARRQSAFQNAEPVKTATHAAAAVGSEELHHAGRNARLDRAPFCSSPRFHPAIANSRGCVEPTVSRSSVSAAIQPDINTIGIPGPGCAAPPAK